MGAGKIIAIIGSVVGIISVALYYVLPEIFCFWRLDATPALGIFLGGFGSSFGEVGGIEQEIQYSEEIILLLVGVVVVAGGALTLIGAFLENKVLAILGGIAMIVGPILLSIALFLEIGDFEAVAAMLPSGENLFFGSYMGGDWGIWISFYMAAAGGVLGVIGGATVE